MFSFNNFITINGMDLSPKFSVKNLNKKKGGTTPVALLLLRILPCLNVTFTLSFFPSFSATPYLSDNHLLLKRMAF
jgi:hypothetical protein